MKADINNLFKIIMLIILFICFLLHVQRFNHDMELDRKVSEIIEIQQKLTTINAITRWVLGVIYLRKVIEFYF